MHKPKLIALDLDGTLLNSEKELTARSAAALRAAAEAGMEIVPSTGRFYRGMPEVIRALPYVKYVITINGAEVYDIRTGEKVYSASIPPEDAVRVMEYLDTLPVIYDCYMDGWGYMTASMHEKAEDYISNAPSLKMVRELRSPVPELKAFVRERQRGIQKLQLFTRDIPLRDALVSVLKAHFPDFVISTALPNNVEINCAAANKGDALKALTEYLGLEREDTMAFGDGLNDLAMIEEAGCGVCMANGHPICRDAADLIAPSCDEDGVAAVIERMLGNRNTFSGKILYNQPDKEKSNDEEECS
ncbi:MAG: HAD family phosphatase [Lachnospiraceae bacterium]|nr:HAD family phosphatase [Lachnospiraceae bacterium]